jgi:pimeloyl-ACP methyl ester carboxylesterase
MAEDPTAHFHPSDLRALARLVTDATTGIVDLVESVHTGVAPPGPGPAGGIAPLTYRAIRGATRLIGGGTEVTLAQVGELLGRREESEQRRAVLAALNGVWGDYLASSDSPLALPMTLRADGPIPPGGKVALFIHGLCLNDRCWQRGGFEYGAALAGDLGYTSVYLTYNSGQHISANGRALAAVLEEFVHATQPTELVMIGHSLGGLVARSAAHYGAAEGRRWPSRLRALVLLGAPHHGAPLERGGAWLHALMDASPYIAPFTRLGRRRSAGITDLRYGALLDEDWRGRDRFAHGPDDTRIVPLPSGACCYAVAGLIAAGDSPAARLLGDGLVPLDSALGRHADPARAVPFAAGDTWIGRGLSHLDLLASPAVYERMSGWLAGDELGITN